MSEWRLIAEHPKSGANASRVLVWGHQTGVQFGKVYNYADGYLRAQAEGYHGDWQITHYMPIPSPPLRGPAE